MGPLDMAKAKAEKLPITRRIQQALEGFLSIGSDLRVPDASELPARIDKRRNAQIEQFNAEHRMIADLFVVNEIRKWVDKNYERRRDEIAEKFDLRNLEVGDHPARVYDNVALGIKVADGQSLLNRDLLRTVLVTKYKFSAAKAEECIELSTFKGKNSLRLSASVVE